MGIESGDVLQTLSACCIQHGNPAAFVPSERYIDLLFRGVVPHIVGVLTYVHGIQEFERLSIVNSHLSVCAIRDKKLVELPDIDHALGIGSSWDAVDVATSKRVYY